MRILRPAAYYSISLNIFNKQSAIASLTSISLMLNVMYSGNTGAQYHVIWSTKTRGHDISGNLLAKRMQVKAHRYAIEHGFVSVTPLQVDDGA